MVKTIIISASIAIVIITLSVIITLGIVINPEQKKCIRLEDKEICSSPDEMYDLSLMKNNTEPKAFLTGNPYHCNKYDKIKSGAINGTYDGRICPVPGLYLIPVNVTYEEQIAECRNLYDELTEQTKVANDSVCADLGIPDCQALVIYDWGVFQKKFCDWDPLDLP